MSEISDLSSILQNSLLLTNVNGEGKTNHLQTIQNQLKTMPSVLDEDTITKLKNGEYEISLKEYTNLNAYNTMMNAMYGNRSANSFQNTLNVLTNSAEDELATAKSFIDSMKQNGMSNKTALQTYSALKKYSLMSSFGNYNFIKAKA